MSFWKKKNQENSTELATDMQSSGEADSAGREPSQVVPSKTNDTKDEFRVENQPVKEDRSKPVTSNNTASETQAAGNFPSDNQQDSSFSKVRSALSAGTVIQGKLSFDTPVRIDGKLSGEVYSSRVLIVGETAQINASIEASSLIIMGHITGTIKATEKVQLCKGSTVEGNIISPSLIIESGARFNGKSEMIDRAKETKIISDDNLDLANMLGESPKSSPVKKKDNKGGEVTASLTQ